MVYHKNWYMPWIVATTVTLSKGQYRSQVIVTVHIDLEFIQVPKLSSDCLVIIVDLCQDPESLVYRETDTSDKSEFIALCSSALFYLANF